MTTNERPSSRETHICGSGSGLNHPDASWQYTPAQSSGIFEAKFAQATSGVHIESAPSCALGVFQMNTKEGPWSDVHVRRAVAYALNRPDIIAAAGSVGGQLHRPRIRPALLGLRRRLRPLHQVRDIGGIMTLYVARSAS